MALITGGTSGKRPSPEKDSRRPSFTKDEWPKINTGMRERVKEGWRAHKRNRSVTPP